MKPSFLLWITAKTSMIKLGLVCIRNRDKAWNAILRTPEDYLRNALSTLKGTSIIEANIIPWKFLKVLPWLVPVASAALPNILSRSESLNDQSSYLHIYHMYSTRG